MSDSINETKICNMALGRLGTKRINDYTDNSDTKVEAIQCRLHYKQTRDALLRSHWWRFARSRKTLSANTISPDFEYTYAYDLPNDFMRLWIKPFEDNNTGLNNSRYTFSMEGKQLLSNETPMKIRYIRQVTDPTEFDPLFIEVLILKLALKMFMPLAGAGRNAIALKQELENELYGTRGRPGLMSRVRAVDKRETNSVGRADRATWNDSRMVGAGNPAKNYS